MGLFPSRPKVQLYTSEALFAGRNCQLAFDVIASDDARIDYIDVHVIGEQGWRISSGKSSIGVTAEFPRLHARVHDALTLAAGETRRFSATFELPPSLPPTHAIGVAWAKLEARIHVAIPWWPDRRETYRLAARQSPPRTLDRQPVIGRSVASRPDAPRLDVSLGSVNLVAGEVLVGSCALFHVDDRKERSVELALVPTLTLTGRGSPRDRRASPYVIELTLPAGSAGQNVPFQFRIPSELTPSFRSATHQLEWFLVARSGSFLGGKQEVVLPLQIYDPVAATTTPRLVAAPALGDDRIAAAFERFAVKRGWRHAAGTADAIAMVRDHGDAALEIAYEYRDKEGAFLVSRVRHPSLGLDLSVTPSSTLRHVFFRDVEVGDRAWDAAHRVAARDEAQATPFLAAVVPALAAAPHESVGPLVHWSDDALVLARPVTDVDARALEAIEPHLERIADAVARERHRIPPPSGLDVSVPDWQSLAARLDGFLVLGELAIVGGRIGTRPVDIALTWTPEAKPRDLRVTVGSADSANDALREVRFALARPASDVLGSMAAEAVVDRLTRWSAHFVNLRVDDGTASATCAGTMDATEVGRLATELAAMLEELAPGAGPYR